MNNEKDFIQFETPEKNCWETHNDLMTLLPKVVIGKSKGSIGRYGFFQLLAQKCEIKMPFRPFGEWTHGWSWDERPNSELFGFSKLRRNIPIVVCNKTEQQAFKNEGFTNIHIGGLPFAYVKKQHKLRNPHSLLAFPPHSTENLYLINQQFEYLDFLASLRNDFDGIYVSIFGHDWGGDLHEAAKRRGLKTVLGAHPNDLNSLYRTRSLFDAFSVVTSNTMGSHFIYALSADCHFSLSGPKYSYNEELPVATDTTKTAKNKLLEIYSEEYLRPRFRNFYHDHPSSGIKDFDFGKSEVGVGNKLSTYSIRKILGLSMYGQFRGASRGVKNKMVGGISKLLDRNLGTLP